MIERDFKLDGATYCLKFDHLPEEVFITINSSSGKVYEIFINSVDPGILLWSPVASRLLSAIFRKGGDISFVIKELEEMHSAESFFYKGQQYLSVMQVIGEILKSEIKRVDENGD